MTGSDVRAVRMLRAAVATLVVIALGTSAHAVSAAPGPHEMDLEAWDRADRTTRENAIGRRLNTGAPVTGTAADDPPDLEAVDELGFPRIDDAAHVRRAHAMPRTSASCVAPTPTTSHLGRVDQLRCFVSDTPWGIISP